MATAWDALGLDSRLVRAAIKMGLEKPNLVQEKTIPIALEGKDILCRARTGSGKTAAYCLPVLQRILTAKQRGAGEGGPRVRALILVPTRELSEQVRDYLKALSLYCAADVRSVLLSADAPVASQKALLADVPDVIVTTPARIVAHINARNVNLKDSLEVLVIDEADLVLTYGYDEDIRAVLSHAPKIYQALLMSATLDTDVDELKQLLLRNAAIVKLEEMPDHQRLLKEYYVYCEETDKYLLLYFILQMKLVPGKAIIFVNDVERGYRVRLFLEQFGMRACVLNAELPQNSRYHIVQEFNRGIYDYVIATDQATVIKPSLDAVENAAKKARGKGKGVRRHGDADYGVSRGVDFRDVAVVFNFDFPADRTQYRHRVGRTARAGREGTALSFVSMADKKRFLEVTREGNTDAVDGGQGRTDDGEESQDEVAEAEAHEEKGEQEDKEEQEEEEEEEEPSMEPLKFKMDDVNAFRYRVEDALRAVTRAAVKEARLKEIKSELLASEKLKAHFEDNPRDLAALRHDKPLQTARVQPHLRNVPNYLLPARRSEALTGADALAGKRPAEEEEPAQQQQQQQQRTQQARKKRMLSRVVEAAKKRNADPLKSLSYASKSASTRSRRR